MAPAKRKAVTDERPVKKVKGNGAQTGDRSAKRAGRAPHTAASNETKTDDTQKKSASASILQQDERAFPRGGGSVLTPLEHRQIKAQAERDVLLEQENGQAPDQDEDLFDKENRGTAKKSRRKPGAAAPSLSKPEASGVKIFGLSYKNLVVGSLVLGRVTAISSRDVAIALPNNLTGYVPITNISGRLNSRIEKFLASEEAPIEDLNEDDEDVDLKQLFHAGQWLRAVVTATRIDSTEGDGRGKRHIELAIDPAQVNSAYTRDGVTLNTVVQASVRSVEDHGIVMDIGLTDNQITGFVSKKELGATYDLEKVQEGQVMLCLVTGKGSNGQVIKLSPDATRFSIVSSSDDKAPILSEAPSINAFQPGAGVSVLIVESGPGGVVGKLMGMQDVIADVLHSASDANDDMNKKYKIGSRVKARIVWSIPNDDGTRHVGVSFLEHLLTMTPAFSKLPPNATQKQRSQSSQLDQELRSSTIIENAKVVKVLSDRGLYLSIPNIEQTANTSSVFAAYAHISQLSDDRVDSIASATGHFKLESNHRVRVLSFNPVDNLYYVSLKPSTLAQPFLRLEDLEIGHLVTGIVDKMLLGGSRGIVGVLVKLSDGLTALVPEVHLSDTQLKHPERKFREGLSVKARVLSVDTDKRQARLTLKKSLVDDTIPQSIWKQYDDLQPGMESKGTIARLLPQGAAVQFYGSVRAWLPVAEMSETFVPSPDQFFRLGQTVNVRIVSINPEAGEMKVSCKEDDTFSPEKQKTWDDTSGGDIVNGEVAEKNMEGAAVDLSNGLRGVIRTGHLLDGSVAKAESSLKRLQVGQKLENLLVLEKMGRSRTLLLSNKPSLIKDARSGSLIGTFEAATVGQKVRGFVKNITTHGVYVQFANGLVGMLPKSQLLPESLTQPSFGFRTDQSVTAWVIFVDSGNERISLSMRDQKDANAQYDNMGQNSRVAPDVEDPFDEAISSMADFTTNRITKARIASVKATQVNVRLARNVQGRIDVSEAFDTWEEITNKSTPLQIFKPSTVIDVKVLGIHDARSHRFLPISHRQGKVPVFELSAKKSRIAGGQNTLLTLDSVTPGASYLAFVNNHSEGCVWVNLSPNVRGRIALMDLSYDLGLLQNVARHFPVGSALRVQVKGVDVASNRLDLTAKQESQAAPLGPEDLSPGMVLAVRIIQITERLLIVQLSDSTIGSIGLAELCDDYEQVNLAQYSKYDIVRACVIHVELSNKRIHLSLRPSKVLSSSLPVKDPQITTMSQLKQGDLVRGFVKNISDKGVFVSLGASTDAFVRVSDLSDQYIKDWKSIYSVDQLVQGRITAIDQASKNVQLSLKSSHVQNDYQPPITINELQIGQVVSGKVRKVEDFGAFIDIDNTQPKLSGLCHRSQVAAKRVDDVRKLYSAGDIVKAIILQVDAESRKISLGLKASYFDHDETDDIEDGEGDRTDSISDSDEDLTGGVGIDELDKLESVSNVSEERLGDAMEVDEEASLAASSGLKTSGFDWTGMGLDADANDAVSESEPETATQKTRKRNKAEIKVDKTGELDEFGPQSVSDFERQLLGQPNDSGLWIQYMAFQLQLSEIQKARDVAERALRTINIRETEEKANIWIAWLNLEVEYSDADRVEDVFKQACQLQDPLEMHEKLASIYIDSGKLDQADAVFDRMIGNKTFRASPEVWYNYATYLMDTLKSPSRARALLSRALQSIPTHEHRSLTAKFAALEFRSDQGDVERGRTIFEGLVTEWPKWSSGWDMWVDLERTLIASSDSKDEKDEAQEKVRALFGRIVNQKLKKRRARFVFKKWLEFEELVGNERQADRVKALAKDYVEKLQSAGEDEMDA